MSETGSSNRGADGAGGGAGGGAGSGGCGGAGGGAGGEAAAAGRPLHAQTFKLRFAATREQGRSYVSLVKPRALPATVTDKFYSRSATAAAAGAALDDAGALRRIKDMLERGPREVYLAPVTTSHQYGWWWKEAWGGSRASGRGDRRLQHHIRDSAWLKARLLVLAADDKLARR